MQVSELMTTDPVYIKPEITLNDAAIVMKKIDTGVLPIGDGRKLLGILTDRDIIVRALAEDKSPDITCVEEIMTPDIWYCYEHEPIEKAADYMKNMQVRRLIVLNDNKDFVGVVSLGDLDNRAANEFIVGEVMENVSA
jgi:CBS domain-containing protein